MLLRDPKQLSKLLLIQRASHRQLAQAAGWRRWDPAKQKWVGNHSMVGRLANGDRRTVTPERARLIAAFFGLAVTDLFVPDSDSKTVRPDQHHGSTAA